MKPITAIVFLSTLCLLQHEFALAASNRKPTTPGTGPVNVQLIEQACQNAAHKELCLNSLKNDPNSKGADLTGLAFITIRQAAANAADVEAHLRSMMQKNVSSLEPAIQQGISDCIEHYSDANDQLDDTSAALSVKAFNDIDVWVNVAIGDADNCDSAAAGDTVIKQKNEHFRQLCENVLDVVKVLNQKH